MTIQGQGIDTTIVDGSAANVLTDSSTLSQIYVIENLTVTGGGEGSTSGPERAATRWRFAG